MRQIALRWQRNYRVAIFRKWSRRNHKKALKATTKERQKRGWRRTGRRGEECEEKSKRQVEKERIGIRKEGLKKGRMEGRKAGWRTGRKGEMKAGAKIG